MRKEPRPRINPFSSTSDEVKDKTVGNTFFNDMVIKKIKDCYKNISDKNDIRYVDKELIMILALYEIWGKNYCHDSEISINNSGRIWNQLNIEKKRLSVLNFMTV